MTTQLYVDLDHNGNQLIDVRLEKLAADPVGLLPGDVGRIWYNTTQGIQKYWDGVQIVELREVSIASPATILNVGSQTTISVQASSAAQNGYMSAADKAKLDAATASPTPNRLVIRDAAGRFQAVDPVANQDVATKQYVDFLVDETLKPLEGFDAAISPFIGGGPEREFPSLYGGESVQKGDSYRIVSPATLGNVNSHLVNAEDLMIALVDGPSITDGSDWLVAESNRDQATETVKGVAELATQAESDAGVNDLTIVTPLKLLTSLQNGLYTRRFSQYIGDGVADTFTVTHGLGTLDVVVQVVRNLDGQTVTPVVLRLNVNQISVEFIGPNPDVDEFNVIVVG